MTGKTKLEKKLLKNPPPRLTDLTTAVLGKKGNSLHRPI